MSDNWPEVSQKERIISFFKLMEDLSFGFTKGHPDFENRKVCQIWYWAFKEYDMEILEEATKQSILTLDWFPSIAELRRLADVEVWKKDPPKSKD